MNRTTCKRAVKATLILWSAQPLLCSAAEPVRSMEIVEASAFLEAYRAASEAQSASFYDLYSDRAVVYVRVEGNAQGTSFRGRFFKSWGRQLLNEARAVPDASVFREPTVEQRGSRLFIRAKRYSTARCYWDLDYAVGIEREGSNYRIVDERLSTRPDARCEAPRTVNATASITPVLSPVFLPPAPSASVRSPDLAAAHWRPLSQQELADRAMQLAQQIAAARASQVRAGGSASSVPGAAPLATDEIRDHRRPVASLAEPATDLRMTPEE